MKNQCSLFLLALICFIAFVSFELVRDVVLVRYSISYALPDDVAERSRAQAVLADSAPLAVPAEEPTAATTMVPISVVDIEKSATASSVLNTEQYERTVVTIGNLHVHDRTITLLNSIDNLYSGCGLRVIVFLDYPFYLPKRMFKFEVLFHRVDFEKAVPPHVKQKHYSGNAGLFKVFMYKTLEELGISRFIWLDNDIVVLSNICDWDIWLPTTVGNVSSASVSSGALRMWSGIGHIGNPEKGGAPLLSSGLFYWDCTLLNVLYSEFLHDFFTNPKNYSEYFSYGREDVHAPHNYLKLEADGTFDLMGDQEVMAIFAHVALSNRPGYATLLDHKYAGVVRRNSAHQTVFDFMQGADRNELRQKQLLLIHYCCGVWDIRNHLIGFFALAYNPEIRRANRPWNLYRKGNITEIPAEE